MTRTCVPSESFEQLESKKATDRHARSNCFAVLLYASAVSCVPAYLRTRARPVKTWLCAVATLFLLMSPVKAQETFIVPLSKKADNTISLELLCQKDGRVGPFINISRCRPPRSGRRIFFPASTLSRMSIFFESNEQNVISFPVTWTYADGRAERPASSSPRRISAAGRARNSPSAFAASPMIRRSMCCNSSRPAMWGWNSTASGI